MERPLRTQFRITASAQATLAVGCLIGAVLMLGPFQGAERHLLLPDKAAHAIAFFLFTLLSFLAAPRLRKNDLALVALALASASEVAQSVVGRSASMEDLMADAAGIFAAWALMWAAQVRRRPIGRTWDNGSGRAARALFDQDWKKDAGVQIAGQRGGAA
jgi:VanZ family protein